METGHGCNKVRKERRNAGALSKRSEDIHNDVYFASVSISTLHANVAILSFLLIYTHFQFHLS